MFNKKRKQRQQEKLENVKSKNKMFKPTDFSSGEKPKKKFKDIIVLILTLGVGAAGIFQVGQDIIPFVQSIINALVQQ